MLQIVTIPLYISVLYHLSEIWRFREPFPRFIAFQLVLIALLYPPKALYLLAFYEISTNGDNRVERPYSRFNLVTVGQRRLALNKIEYMVQTSNTELSPFELMAKHLSQIPEIIDQLETLKTQKEPEGIPYAGTIDNVLMPLTGWKKSTCYLKLPKMPTSVAVKRAKSWTIYRDNLIQWMQRQDRAWSPSTFKRT